VEALAAPDRSDEARPKLPDEPHRRCRVNSNPLKGSAINGYTYQKKLGTLPGFLFRTPRFLWFEYLIQPKFQQVNEGFRSKGPSGVSGFTDCVIGFLIFNKNMGSVPGFPRAQVGVDGKS
jgi:hypothetical protein